MTMTLKQINANIKSVATKTGALNVLIQDTAVATIAHAVEHQDANPAMRLVAAVAPRLRAPLVAWFETYSKINITKGADGLKCSISKAEGRSDNLDGARANVWYETEKAKADDLPMTIEDVDAKIISLAKTLQKRLDDGKVLEADRAAFVEKIAAIKALNKLAA